MKWGPISTSAPLRQLFTSDRIALACKLYLKGTGITGHNPLIAIYQYLQVRTFRSNPGVTIHTKPVVFILNIMYLTPSQWAHWTLHLT